MRMWNDANNAKIMRKDAQMRIGKWPSIVVIFTWIISQWDLPALCEGGVPGCNAVSVLNIDVVNKTRTDIMECQKWMRSEDL